MKLVQKLCLLLMLIVGFSFDSHALTNAEVMTELSEIAHDVNKDLPTNMEGMMWDKFQFIEKGSRGIPEMIYSYTMYDYERDSFSPEAMKEMSAQFINFIREGMSNGLGTVTVADMRRINLGVKIVFYNKFHKNIATFLYSSSEIF